MTRHLSYLLKLLFYIFLIFQRFRVIWIIKEVSSSILHSLAVNLLRTIILVHPVPQCSNIATHVILIGITGFHFHRFEVHCETRRQVHVALNDLPYVLVTVMYSRFSKKFISWWQSWLYDMITSTAVQGS